MSHRTKRYKSEEIFPGVRHNVGSVGGAGGSVEAQGRGASHGQSSISLEYQTYTSAHLFDTLVTGMAPGVRHNVGPVGGAGGSVEAQGRGATNRRCSAVVSHGCEQ